MKYTKEQIDRTITELYVNSYEKARTLLFNQGKGNIYIDDIIQEVFYKIVRVMTEGTDKNINEAYFMFAVKSMSIDRFRGNHYKKETFGDDISMYGFEGTNFGNDSEGLNNDNDIDLEMVLLIINEKLDEDDRNIIKAIYFDGYTIAEVAKDINMNLNTLLLRVQTIYSKVRNIYNSYNNSNLTKLNLSNKSEAVRNIKRMVLSHRAERRKKSTLNDSKFYKGFI